jgi:hypothetical protein
MTPDTLCIVLSRSCATTDFFPFRLFETRPVQATFDLIYPRSSVMDRTRPGLRPDRGTLN